MRDEIALLWALREGSYLSLPDLGFELCYDSPYELTLVCLQCDQALPWRVGWSGLRQDTWDYFPTAEAAIDSLVRHLEGDHRDEQPNELAPRFAGATNSIEAVICRRRFWRSHGGRLGESTSHGMLWREGCVLPSPASYSGAVDSDLGHAER